MKNTRKRILEAATHLFDLNGMRSVTVDAIAAQTGVTKRTLYYHFRSKDDLVAAALTDGYAEERRQLLLAKHHNASLEQMVESVFANVAHSAADSRWKGCLFTRAAFEMAGLPGHPAIAAARAEKNHIEQLFAIEFSSLDVPCPRMWASRLIILLEGAIAHSTVHHDPRYAIEAGQMAMELIAKAKQLQDGQGSAAPDLAPVASHRGGGVRDAKRNNSRTTSLPLLASR